VAAQQETGVAAWAGANYDKHAYQDIREGYDSQTEDYKKLVPETK
jgi:hypothetical protein